MKRTVIAAILVFLFAGCASGGTPMNPPSATASSSAGGHGDVSEARWNAILTDLEGRDVATDAVQLVSAEQVTWNDGSLGCAQPGQSYTQAIVDGQQVIVSVDGKEYDYRFGTSDNPKLCTQKLRARGIRLR